MPISTIQDRYPPIELLRYAGLFAWVCAAIPLLLMYAWYPEPLGSEQYLGWWILHVLFGFTYWNQVRELPVRTSMPHRLLTVSVLTITALGVSLMSETALGGILLLVVGGLLPWMLPMGWAVAWLLGQNIALVLVLSNISDIPVSDAALTGGLFLAVSLFAFMSGMVGLRQNEARDELRKVNSELRATQALLADNTRIAERVRIARELHDLVGHHLTALTLNLEVATHLVDGKALEHVQQAHSLAKLLLVDVREVVSEMRLDDKVDLSAALKTLVSGMPEPRIHLDLPLEVALTDPVRAQVMLRCAQEIITNSVRHARADNLWITLERGEDRVTLKARDDGRGAKVVTPGNGLIGMTERLQGLNGGVDIDAKPGEGFRLSAWVPSENTDYGKKT